MVTPRTAALTLAIGALGALVAWAVHMPIFILTGPALAVCLASLAGQTTGLPDPLRDGAFLLIGIGIGAGVTPESLNALLRWPLAFAILALTLYLTILISVAWLRRSYGFGRQEAVLASAPGHLSFVLSIGLSIGSDTSRIAVAQTIRLMALTLTVPIVALAFGLNPGRTILPPGQPMGWLTLLGLLVLSLALALLLKRLRLPGPFILAPMALSAGAHVTEIVTGVLHPPLAMIAFLVMGALIGSRFSGLTVNALRQTLAAGCAVTFVAVACAALAAVPAAAAVGMPLAHVLVAFAPGGLETMIAMGSVLGASPGFVAGAHLFRLLVLSFLIPALVGRTGP